MTLVLSVLDSLGLLTTVLPVAGPISLPSSLVPQNAGATGFATSNGCRPTSLLARSPERGITRRVEGDERWRAQ
jgi:hypothetical protein